MDVPDSKFACRATLIHCLDDPGIDIDSSHMQIIENGMLVIDNGLIEAIGPEEEIRRHSSPLYPLKTIATK